MHERLSIIIRNCPAEIVDAAIHEGSHCLIIQLIRGR
jgi:hypothetical protein